MWELNELANNNNVHFGCIGFKRNIVNIYIR